MKKIIIGCVLLVVLLLISSIALKDVEDVKIENKVSFSLTGDVIGHDSLLENSKTETGYDFTYLFSDVKSLFTSDINYANFETSASDNFPYTGYPLFNAPSQLIDDLINTGFNLFSISSNHSLDYGTEALKDTSDYFENTDAIVSGYNESCELFNVDEFSKNGIDFSFVSYTDILNSGSSEDCNINSFTNDQIEEQLKSATAKGDVNIISLHYGEEGLSELSQQDTEIEEKLLGYGFELIIGTHPHVLKPMKKTVNKDGNEALIVYSLGNFVHTQLEDIQRLGVVLKFDIILEEDKVKFRNISSTPTYMYYDWGDSGYTYKEGDDPTNDLLMKRENLKVIELENLSDYTSQEHEDSVKKLYQDVVDDSVLE
jgi:poly-gamma-glutamate synthesis protein (capsule biosynthesis protein)